MEFGDAVKVQAALLKGKAKKPEGAEGARPSLVITTEEFFMGKGNIFTDAPILKIG
jgi:hypothetical protein